MEGPVVQPPTNPNNSNDPASHNNIQSPRALGGPTAIVAREVAAPKVIAGRGGRIG